MGWGNEEPEQSTALSNDPWAAPAGTAALGDVGPEKAKN